MDVSYAERGISPRSPLLEFLVPSASASWSVISRSCLFSAESLPGSFFKYSAANVDGIPCRRSGSGVSVLAGISCCEGVSDVSASLAEVFGDWGELVDGSVGFLGVCVPLLSLLCHLKAEIWEEKRVFEGAICLWSVERNVGGEMARLLLYLEE